jgi:hypothetical protein
MAVLFGLIPAVIASLFVGPLITTIGWNIAEKFG